MKTATFLALAAAGKLAAAHATFQEILVNGKSQGTTGVRGTSDGNNPILSTAADLASDMMICKGGASVTGSVSVAGGDKITLQWHHNNPSSGAGDADEPIAASHKGPILVYVADAKTEGKGNAWVKIYEEGLSGGKWAVDNFIANAGAIDVTLPDLAAGDYLIRSEIIALHEGDREGKAQFYNGCGQITVTSAGSLTIANGNDIQAVYKTDDAGVKFNIYGGATEYPIPGPAVSAGFSGSGSTAPSSTKATTSAAAPTTSAAAPTTSAAAPTTTTAAAPATTTAVSSYVVTKPTTLVTSVRTTTTAKPAATTGASTGSVGRWYQCGGIGYTGATGCASGLTCKKQNDYYHQCVDATLGY